MGGGRERGAVKSGSGPPAGGETEGRGHKEGATASSGEGAGGNRGENEEMGAERRGRGGRADRGGEGAHFQRRGCTEGACIRAAWWGAGGVGARESPGPPAGLPVAPLWRCPPRRGARGVAADVSGSLGTLGARPHPGARGWARPPRGHRRGGACSHAAPQAPRGARGGRGEALGGAAGRRWGWREEGWG